jgi:Trypsin-like peptidase domain
MKKLFVVLMAVILFVTVQCAHIQKVNLLKSDRYVRDRVLMIYGRGILCSAIEIRAPSGKNYTMSAAHCYEMAVNEYVTAQAEDGSEHMIKVLQVDKDHDLMLLEAFDDKFIDVAKDYHTHEHVHTLTHGHGQPTYRTDGELLKVENVRVAIPIESDEDLAKCTNIIQSALEVSCELKLTVMMSTAAIIPGSSGGAVLDEAGHLVGIVSCGDGFFSGFIPLPDIQNMLKGK